MPGKLITDPAEWERLTGSRGSVYIGPAPARRPKRHEVFLCPHCLETLTSPRSGILRCAPCNKTWERETGQEVFCRVPRKCANSFEFKADITTGRLSALGQKQTYAVQIVMSALPPIATLVAYFHEGAACCASATADQICARSKVVPSRWIERDYLSVVLSAQEDNLGAGLPSGPIPMAAPFYLGTDRASPGIMLHAVPVFLSAEFAEVSLTSFSSSPSSGQGSCRNRMGATTLAAPAGARPLGRVWCCRAA
jgi:hypothetical protein